MPSVLGAGLRCSVLEHGIDRALGDFLQGLPAPLGVIVLVDESGPNALDEVDRDRACGECEILGEDLVAFERLGATERAKRDVGGERAACTEFPSGILGSGMCVSLEAMHDLEEVVALVALLDPLRVEQRGGQLTVGRFVGDVEANGVAAGEARARQREVGADGAST